MNTALDTATIDGRVELMTGVTQEVEVANEISRAFADAKTQMETAIRKVVICGLMMIEQKGRCKHGEFGPWLEKNCPEIHWATANRWMETSNAVTSILQIPHRAEFASGRELPLFRLLSMPVQELPPEAVEIQEKVFGLVDGKTQKQLLLSFKDTEPPKREYHPPVRTPEQIAQDEKWNAGVQIGALIDHIRVAMDGVALGLVDDSLFDKLDNYRLDLGHIMKQIRDKRQAASKVRPKVRNKPSDPEDAPSVRVTMLKQIAELMHQSGFSLSPTGDLDAGSVKFINEAADEWDVSDLNDCVLETQWKNLIEAIKHKLQTEGLV